MPCSSSTTRRTTSSSWRLYDRPIAAHAPREHKTGSGAGKVLSLTSESKADLEVRSRLTREASRSREGVVSRLVVIGMHRSGTSAMAGALCAAGAWVGEPDQLMPGDEFNRHGYFERQDTAELLDEVLGRLGGTWKCPPLAALTRLRLEPFRPLLTKIMSDVSESAPAGRVPLVKDPRLTLFASELPSVLGGTQGIVVCVRHPLVVARSLRARDGIPLTTGLAIWEAYNVVLSQGLSGRPVRVRLFDEDTERRLPLGDFAGQILRNETPSTRSLEAGLIHQHADNDDELQWLSANQLHVWQALVEAGRAPQPTLLTAMELSAVAERELANSHRHQSMAVDDNRYFAGPGESGLQASVERSVALAAMDDRALAGEPARPNPAWEQQVAALQQSHEEMRQALEEERVLRAQSEEQRRALVLECESAVQDRDRLTLVETDLAVTAERLHDAESSAESLRDELHALYQHDLGEVRALADAQIADAQTAIASLYQELEASRAESQGQKDASDRALRPLQDELARLTSDLEAAMSLMDEAEVARREADGLLTYLWSELEVAIAEREAHERAESAWLSLEAAAWTREELLLRELDFFRGLHEETVTAYGTANATCDRPSHEDLRAWLDQIAVTQLRGRKREADDELADLLCLALAQIDALKGYRSELETAWTAAHPTLRLPEVQVVAEWHRQQILRATTSPADDARVAELRREMSELRAHRDAVVTDLLSITHSESWRLGHALTWPARVLRGGRRKPKTEAQQ